MPPALLGAAIRWIVAVSLPSQDTFLKLSSGHGPREFPAANLELAGGRVEGPGLFNFTFEETLDAVDRASENLDIELSETGHQCAAAAASAFHIKVTAPQVRRLT